LNTATGSGRLVNLVNASTRPSGTFAARGSSREQRVDREHPAVRTVEEKGIEVDEREAGVIESVD
jgi:hypothetical protein